MFVYLFVYLTSQVFVYLVFVYLVFVYLINERTTLKNFLAEAGRTSASTTTGLRLSSMVSSRLTRWSSRAAHTSRCR